MDRYRITMPDGSMIDDYFESDNDAITAATEANRGVSRGITVQRYASGGDLFATHLPEGGHTGTARRHRARPQ
ncbi:hypothetical protein R3Q06_35405 [Rhodococcus erythropolis]|uniref:hypothetical protein n=1 Tax=Rhodococcus erythropolis TaxID=1833 RepID=UPI0029497BC8|nr:hypothetical protein [Rhodococcus erythropolis]MDV6278664.1 hypothetical protein [Rhodococcus erythropolis]